jgi:hypothetical protein
LQAVRRNCVHVPSDTTSNSITERVACVINFSCAVLQRSSAEAIVTRVASVLPAHDIQKMLCI